MAIDVFGNLEQRRARVEATANNTAQTYVHEARFQTRGQGGIVLPAKAAFRMVYAEAPHVAYSYVILGGFQKDLVPMCSGGVRSFTTVERAGNPYWVSAQCMVNVVVDDVIGSGGVHSTNYLIEHHFTFTGLAYKPVTTDALR